MGQRSAYALGAGAEPVAVPNFVSLILRKSEVCFPEAIARSSCRFFFLPFFMSLCCFGVGWGGVGWGAAQGFIATLLDLSLRRLIIVL